MCSSSRWLCGTVQPTLPLAGHSEAAAAVSAAKRLGTDRLASSGDSASNRGHRPHNGMGRRARKQKKVVTKKKQTVAKARSLLHP